MPKLLSDILKGKKSSKTVEGSTGKNPGVDYKPKAGDEQKFVAKHKTEKHDNRVGNGPDVFAGGKTDVADHPRQSQDAYEEVNEAAVMQYFHGTDGDHDGSPQKAENDHDRILGHLAKTVGTKHPVYKSVSKDLKAAQRAHHSADRHYDNPDKNMDFKDRAHDYERSAKETYASHIRSSKLKEGAEQVDEVLTKKSPAGEWIKDFVDSDNPKFAGKSKDKRKQMALAAYYAKQRSESVSEAKDSDDTDDEISMVATELRAICADAQDLLNKMPKNMHIEPWVQSKVAVAKSMISGVRDYMLNKTANEEHVHEGEEVLPPKNKKLITEKSKCSKCGGSKFKPKGKSMVCESCDTPINMSRSGGEGEPNKVAAYNLDVARV